MGLVLDGTFFMVWSVRNNYQKPSVSGDQQEAASDSTANTKSLVAINSVLNKIKTKRCSTLYIKLHPI